MSWLAKILGQQDINSLPELDPERVISFQKQEESLAIQYSGAMGLWHEAQANSEPLYEEENVNSLSVEGHARAEEFRKFMGITQDEVILDIGCGTQSLPSYLADADISKVYGIDPIGGSYRAYNYYEGFAEFVPWYSRSFDRVVVATSFDHFIDPTVVMSQIHRVLKKGGTFEAWVFFVDDAPDYDPHKVKERMDDFHVYHLNPNYWTKLVQPFFNEVKHHQSFNEGYKADTFFSYKKN